MTTQSQLERAAERARIATDLELAYITGEISPELADKLRFILVKANELEIME